MTWTNKDLCLLSAEDGGYEWVEPGDYRAREVRLLQEQGRVNDPQGRSGPSGLLIQGDSLNALRSLARMPEYAEQYAGKVKLCYIDPPFNTGQAFEHYDDALEHSVWLGMMRERLIAIRELLARDGSVWVHLDDAEQAYCKVLLDEIFGRDNFIATVVWQKASRDNRSALSTSQDYLLIYAKDPVVWKARRNLLPRSADDLKSYKNPDNDPRGPWRPDNFSAQAGPGRRAAQFYTLVTPAGKACDPPSGRCWLFTEDRYEELLNDGRVWFGSDGTGRPTLKRFLSEVQDGLVPLTWWPYSEVGDNRQAKKEVLSLFPGVVPFDTPKPERLLERIIQIATNPGDIVLDCFGGSGTTAAVAHKMRRNWVTVERNPGTVRDFTAPRLRKVVGGEDLGGITEAAAWKGGGSFHKVRVAPAMVVEQDGLPALADWARGKDLERAVAAQLRVNYVPQGPFCGRRGRERLAVVDGVADAKVAEALLAALSSGEALILAATSIRYEATDLLKSRAPGSRTLKIPQFLRHCEDEPWIDLEGTERFHAWLRAAAPDASPAVPGKDASEVTAAPPARVLTPDQRMTIHDPVGVESAPADPDYEEEQVDGRDGGGDGHE